LTAARQLNAEIHNERIMIMKKTNKKNPTMKIVSAAAMLAVSASMLGTSTYAWFTMNKEVQVTGLTMTTKVGSNLLICSDNVEANYKADTLLEGRQALLEPVSSVGATTGSFFYSTDATAAGSKAHTAATGSYEFLPYAESTSLANALAGKNAYSTGFNEAYGITTKGSTTAYETAYGYVDYVFYLKATASEDNMQLRMTQCDLNYNNGAITDGDQAWRVALFATELTSGTEGKGNSGDYLASVGALDPAATGSTATSILRMSGASNFTGTNAVATATTYGSAIYDTAAVINTDMDAGVTKYYKVLVRVWLEGEDNTCKSSTYAALSDAWTLDLDFQLVAPADSAVEGKTAVTNITKNAFVPSTTATQEAVTSPIEVATTAAP